MKQYLCIDLKSFYASVECVERGLDPMTTNLVVADPERTDKTICLAITPAMKKLGIKNRCRVFEIPKGVDYIMAPPRMQKYIDYAAEIYGIYLKYISKEDIHVYSIDEAFMDVTAYLPLYQMTARELGQRIMNDISEKVGVRATCGIGTNLYLTKIALDITAKHATDFIGELDEESYRRSLWGHRPLTDFWRIGAGTAKKLANYGIYTTDLLCLDLVAKKLVCKSITLHVGYSNQLNLNPAHGTVSFNDETNSDMAIIPEVVRLYRKIVNPAFAIRRVNITCNHVVSEEYHQYSFFADAATLEKNHKVQEAVVEIKNKFGKNAILKGMNLEKLRQQWNAISRLAGIKQERGIGNAKKTEK